MTPMEPQPPKPALAPQASIAARANRAWWDFDAARYIEEHGEYLSGFFWCPEMLSEKQTQLLGDVHRATVLEVGCGQAACATWLSQEFPDATVVGIDLSSAMLAQAEPDGVLLAQADAQQLPFASKSFDVAFSVFGALPFVPDASVVLREVAGVLKAAGKFVFAVNHPMRWVFPDDPESLTAAISYFEREYLETDESGEVTYAEYHRTFGDWVRAISSAGLELLDVIEPEWPAELTQTWGQWSPKRGRIFPGSIIFVTRKP